MTNKERERRILDAAADLFVRYGYDKTTVSDIAREAGVSQGGIYLHFKGKEDLLDKLIMREMKIYADKWLELIDADPQGGTLPGIYKNGLYALSSSAFMTAMFRRDRRVLGSYFRQSEDYRQEQSVKHEFIKMMQDAGAVRQDLDPKVTAHIMNMLAYGLVAMDEVMDRADIPPIDDLIEGIADVMDKALTPEGGGNSEAGKAIIKHVADLTRQQYKERESQSEEEEG